MGSEKDTLEKLERGSISGNKDAEILASMGYKQELKRNFSIMEVFGIGFSIMSLLPSITSTLSFSLPAGPVGMTWGWLIPTFFILLVGLSMAEMGSALPTSGGLYYWTFKFYPKSIRRPLCFLAGYANTLGLIGGICAIDYGFSTMLLAVVGIASNGSYSPTKYHTYGVYVATIASHAVVGAVATKIVSKLQLLCILLNMSVVIITCIALPIGKGSENLNPGSYVFGTMENLTTWPKGWAFILSWLSAIWTINAFDSCVHMSEEASNAPVAVPFGIIASIVSCSFFGFILNAVIAATMSTDIAATLGSATGQPMAQIYLDVLGHRWAIAMMSVLFVIQWLMGLSVVIAGSRQCWAFSRDGALPFSSVIRVVNTRLSVPLRAVWFMCACALIIGLLSLIDSAATQALFSLSAASVGLAWVLPIFARAVFDVGELKPGPFSLGSRRTSRVIGFIASIYLFFVIFVLAMFPLAGPDPSPSTMNYTVVINGTVWIGCLVYYFVHAHKWFEGPKNTLDDDDAAIEETIFQQQKSDGESQDISTGAEEIAS